MTDYETLEAIPGIGPAIADNLRAAGYETPDAVMSADVEELAGVELLGESSARAILAGEAGGRRGREPRVDEVIGDVRRELEKPISDRAAIAQTDIGRKTHKEWLKKDGSPFDRYQAMYEEARAIAEERLVEGGLYGDADPHFAKFILKATMDYQDKQTVEHEGDGIGPVKVSFTDDGDD